MPQAMSIALASTTPYTKQHLISLSSTAVKYYYQIQSSKFNLYVHTPHPQVSSLFCSRGNYKKREKFSRHRVIVKASGRETPYQVLGVSSSATPDQIKRAYRKLALKYHPDVNKQADAQEKFMRIKHAYNTLLSSKSKDGSSGYSYSNSERNRNRTSQDEEDFYGLGNFMRDVQITLGDFFKDLQEEYRNWEANGASQGKPKSLWEELADIGEEFVEFLEKELNINDVEVEQEKNGETEKDKGSSNSSSSSSLEDNIDEIEAALAQLKRELGL